MKLRSILSFTIWAIASGALSSAPAKAETMVLTLDDALVKAMSQNPSVLSAKASSIAATQRVFESRAGFLPQVQVSLGYSHATENRPLAPYNKSLTTTTATTGTTGNDSQSPPTSFASFLYRDTSDSYNNYSASVGVSQLIWDFGRTHGGYQAAQALQQASTAEVKNAKENLWLTVNQAYFSVLAAQAIVQAAQETKRQMEKHLELAKAQLAAGIRQKIDVTRAMSDLANADLSLLRATNTERLARVTLNNAMGVNTDIQYRVVRPEQSVAIQIPGINEAVKKALTRRGDYQSLQQRVVALEKQITVARSAYYPLLAANGSVTYRTYDPTDFNYNYTVGATLTWNAFSGLHTFHAVKEADANLFAQRAALKNIENAIRAEIESTILAYNEAEQRISPTHSLLETANETLRLAEGRYQAGAGNIVEVTDAQAVQIQAQTGVIQAEFDLEIARARLIKALGLISKDTL